MFTAKSLNRLPTCGTGTSVHCTGIKERERLLFSELKKQRYLAFRGLQAQNEAMNLASKQNFDFPILTSQPPRVVFV